MAAANTGYVQPTGSIRYGDGHIAHPYFAEAAITPGYLVLQGTAVNQVKVNTAGNQNFLGVADINSDAAAEDLSVMTHPFALNDECIVIQSGIVIVVADTAGIVAGEYVQVGISTSGMVDVYTSTAAAAGDTYVTATADTILGEIRDTCGRALETAASGSKALINLRAN